jgi:dynein heavy chain 1
MLSTSSQSTTSEPARTTDEQTGEEGAEVTPIGTPYEGLHSLVHFGVTPWFDAYVNSRKGGVSSEGVAGKKGPDAQMGKWLCWQTNGM